MSTDPSQALAEVARQRAELADRVRLPGWYLGCYGLGWALMIAAPTVGTIYRQGIVGMICHILGVSAVCSLALVLRLVRGVQLPNRRLRAYPSMRRRMRELVGLAVLGAGIVLGSMTGQGIPAMLGALVVGVLAVLVLHRLMAAIAADIRDDRVIMDGDNR